MTEEKDHRGLTLLLGTAAMPLNALAFMILWRWYVAPFGLPEIGFWHSAGVYMVIAYATVGMPPEDNRGKLFRASYAVLKPLVALLLGWAYLMFGGPL